MKKEKITPYLVALICAGFACTQDVFMVVSDCICFLSMKLNYGWFTAFMIASLSVYCCYLLKINWKRYKYNDWTTASLMFFVITILYYRFGHDEYNFIPILGELAYVDIMWLLAVLFIVEAIVNKTTKVSTPINSKSSIYLDSPIETPEYDTLDYYPEALHIASTLSKLPEHKSVSIAILSPWGNGKTSFVNLIKHAIKNGKNGKPMFEHIIIEFNPRQSKNIDSIQEDFFKALIDAIPDKLRLRHKLSNYLENIGLIDVHPIAKIFTVLFKEAKKKTVNDLNNILDNIGKKLVVFIDDFDRLTDKEIIEVLKLIDNNAAFKRTVFITAYDEVAVSNALQKYESRNNMAYIDKFFTLRFHLPLRSNVSVVSVIYQLLQKNVEKDIDLLSIINNRFRIIAECVRNLRDAKSFCNMFQIDYAFNSKHKINFEEYFLLELMKFRYYDDYYNLYNKEYVSNQSLFQDVDAIYTLKEKFSKGKDGKQPKIGLPRSINILKSIFSEYESKNEYGYSTNKPSYRSVQYVRYFDIYFTHRSYGHVQAERLYSLFEMQSDNEIYDFYSQCIEQKAQSDILDFLRNQEWQDMSPKGTLTKKDTFKKFVKLVFLYSAITENNDSSISTLQSQLIYKPNFTKKGYNDMTEQEYHDYLIDIIYKHESTDFIPLEFILSITHTLIPSSSDNTKDVNEFILKGEEVKQKNINLLKKYLKIENQYSPILASIYRSCIERIENSRLIIAEEANSLMRDFLYADKSNEYLKRFLIFNNNSGRIINIMLNDPFFKQIFPVNDGKDLFEEYVKKSLPEDDQTRIEILTYLNKYKKAGSDYTGYFYITNDNPNPQRLEIINGLEF